MPTEPTRPATETAYSKEQASVYDELRFTGASGEALHHFESKRLMEVLQRIGKDASILEVGCGTGRLLVDARAQGYKVNGLDASPHMLEQLRAKFGPDEDIETVVGEAAKIPQPDNTYDAVYSIRVLNQTESPAYALDALTEMLRITKDGGYTFVEFVNAKRPRWGMNKRPTTRLSVAEVVRRGKSNGAEYIYTRGVFFTSMQLYRKVPRLLVPIVSTIDRALSSLFPSLCSRCYVLFRKRAAQA
jgi:ubiquinone/menaquinone biosynthesis C-methylase UbiE